MTLHDPKKANWNWRFDFHRVPIIKHLILSPDSLWIFCHRPVREKWEHNNSAHVSCFFHLGDYRLSDYNSATVTAGHYEPDSPSRGQYHLVFICSRQISCFWHSWGPLFAGIRKKLLKKLSKKFLSILVQLWSSLTPFPVYRLAYWWHVSENQQGILILGFSVGCSIARFTHFRRTKSLSIILSSTLEWVWVNALLRMIQCPSQFCNSIPP